MRKILLFLFWIFPNLSVFTQHYPLTELNFDDGLTRSSFYEVAKDPQGYLWLASETCIFRYDGKEFKQYTAKDGFKGNFVLDIDFDEQGQMWISTYGGGLARFDGERFFAFNTENGFPANYIRSTLFASNGDVWACAEDSGLIRVQRGKKPEIINKRLQKAIQNPWSCCEDKEGNIWVSAIGGLYKFIKAKNYVCQWIYSTPFTHTSVIEDKDGVIWAGGAYSMIKVVKDSVIDITSKIPAETIIFDLHIGKEDGKMYLGTADKLIVMDGDSISVMDKSNGIANAQFWDIYEDEVNELWLSSAGGGVVKYDNHGIGWYGRNEGLNIESSIQDIVVDKRGRIVFGTELDGYFYFENGVFNKFDIPELKDVRTGYSTIYDPKLDVMILTSSNGSVIWLQDNKAIHHFRSDRARGITCYGIQFVDSLEILMATDVGCFVLSPQLTEPKRIESIPVGFFRSAFRDDFGYVWATGDNGDIYRYKNGESKNFQSVINPEKYSVLTGYYDSYYRLYFFCTSSGVIIWNGTERFIFHSGNGLVGDVAGGVIRDKQNLIWISHDKGLTCLDVVNKTTRHIGYDQGFKSVSVNFRSLAIDAKGILYVGSVNELYKINLQNLEPRNRNIKLRLQEVFFRDKVYFKEKYFTSSLPELYLEHDEDNFQIDLAALDYVNADKVKYSWKLKGFDPDFMPYSTFNEANYTNLAPGDYEFIAKAIDSEGFETNEVRMKIHIAKPFWEKIWFYVLEIGIFVMIAIFSFAFSGKKSGHRFGQIMTFLTVIILFESMIFYLSNFINPFTNGIPVFQLLMNILLACVLQPIERGLRKLMDTVNKRPAK